jgi:prepilin-type N-terminal cleavage/methylation domain-containing protein
MSTAPLRNEDLYRKKRRTYIVKKQRGFTLLELLVVIAVIALLMAILTPALWAVKDQTKAVICQSNLHQWGLLFSLYTNNNNRCFMGGWGASGIAGQPGELRWVNALRPYYYDDPRMRCCPMATKSVNPSGGTGFGVPYRPFLAWGVFNTITGPWECREGDYGSYGINGWACDPPRTITSIDGALTKYNWRRIDVRGGGYIPLFLDSIWLDGWPEPWNEPPNYDCEWEGGYNNNMKRFCTNRHNGVINGIFFDSSVRKIGLKQLWKLKWHRNYNTNADPPEWPDWMKKFKDYH